MKNLSIAATLAFIGLPFSDGFYNHASAANYWEPEKGSHQYELLKNYREFVIYMKGCCNLSDGRGGYEEIFNDPDNPDTAIKRILELLAQGAKLNGIADSNPTAELLKKKFPPKSHPYFVIVTHDLHQTELSAPYILPIHVTKVVKTKDIYEACQPRIDAVETKRDILLNQLIENAENDGIEYDEDEIWAQVEENIPESTCIAPPFSLLWADDNSARLPTDDPTFDTLKGEDGIFRKDVSTFKTRTVYCYFPKPAI